MEIDCYKEAIRNDEYTRTVYNTFLSNNDENSVNKDLLVNLIKRHTELLYEYAKETKRSKKIELLKLLKYWENVLLYEFNIVSDIEIEESDFK